MPMLLTSLIPTLYVQISPERLTVRNVKTGEIISEVAEIAIAYDPKPRIVGVGAEAGLHKSNSSIKVINPFGHPRSMVSEFSAAEQLLKAFVHRILKSSFFSPSPKIVMHLLGDPAGGFTQVEIRAFHEMALGAGAAKVVIWQGTDLNDQELLSGLFPRDGSVLS
jgi:rod shape-determining protein MreB